MSKSVRLRLAFGFVLVPFGALLLARCGGNDVVEPPDASADSTFDSSGPDALADALLFDRSRDTSSEGSRVPDAGAEAALPAPEDGSPDIADGGDADASGVDAGDADAASLDAANADAGEADAKVEGAAIVSPPLGTARSFAILASATVTNTGVATAIVGDVGISPGTALVGLTPGQVTGMIHLGDAVAMKAEADVTTAYDDLAGRPCQHTMTSVDLGGKTLPPGVYCFAVSAAQMVGNLSLDGQGDPNAVWIFQIGSTLTIAANLSTIMINGGSACNVYWQVGSSATINGGAQFKGNVVAQASVSLLTGANVSPGRTWAQNGAITMDSTAISTAGCP